MNETNIKVQNKQDNIGFNLLQNQLYNKILSKIKTGNWFIDICFSFCSYLILNIIFNKIMKERHNLQEMLKSPLDNYFNLREFIFDPKDGVLHNKYHKILKDYLIENKDNFFLKYLVKKEMINDREVNKYLIKNKDYWIMLNNKWCILSFINTSDDYISLNSSTIKIKNSYWYDSITDEDIDIFIRENAKIKDNNFSIYLKNESMDAVFYYFKNDILEKSYRYLKPNINFLNEDFEDLRKMVIEKNDQVSGIFDDILMILNVTNRDSIKGNINLAKYDFILTGYSKNKRSIEIFRSIKRFLKICQEDYNRYCKDNFTETSVYKLKTNFNFISDNKDNNNKNSKDNRNNRNKQDNKYIINNYGFNKAGTCLKKIENIHLKKNQKEILLDELESFINEKDIYKDNGIPHNKGFLLKGPPGTGKTSLIKAISNYLKRNIFTIDLTLIDSNDMFLELMDRIDFTQSIIVFEDIDCMSDKVLERVNKEDEFYDSHNDKFTLSCILNFLDGTTEYNERIIIMTTNYPEKLDRALIRPGRIDLQMDLTLCDRHQLCSIINKFFDRKFDQSEFLFFEENKYSPAKIIVSLVPLISKLKDLNDSEIMDFFEGFFNK
jgi:DNA replication protein DnaC